MKDEGIRKEIMRVLMASKKNLDELLKEIAEKDAQGD